MYNRWIADMRVRRAHRVWHEPAMPATWKERFKEIAKDKQNVLWSIDAVGSLVGFALGHLWTMGNGFDVNQLVIDPDECARATALTQRWPYTGMSSTTSTCAWPRSSSAPTTSPRSRS